MVGEFTLYLQNYLIWFREKRIKESLGCKSMIDRRRGKRGIMAKTVQLYVRSPDHAWLKWVRLSVTKLRRFSKL